MSKKPFVPSRLAGLVIALLVVVLACTAGYWAGSVPAAVQAPEAVAALQTRLDVLSAQYRHEVTGLVSAKDAIQSQLLIEQTTRATLETSLQKAQADLAATRERLAFYEQLLPPGPAGAVTIRAFDLESRPGLLSYRVLLMRNGPQGSTFNGLMEFVANGVKNGKNVKIKLEPALAADHRNDASSGAVKNPMQLGFDQFQRAEGLLDIPPGFTVQSVTLNITDGKTVRATRSAGVVAAESAGSAY